MIDTFRGVLEVCPEIIYIGNPTLREKSEEVSLDEGIRVSRQLIDVLTRYRKLTGVGRGLAAPQIGQNLSVFVTYLDDEFQVYMNPKIIKKSPTQNYFIESCLSCGYLSVDVKRPETIMIEYMNEKAETMVTHADGFLARLLQHEFDHLEGIINIDKAEKGTLQFMTDDPLKQQLRKAH